MVSPHVIRRGQEEVSVALFDRDAVQAKEPQSGDEGIVLGTQVIYVTGRGDTGTDAVYHVIGVLAAMRARAEVAP
jgi:hypothetical protein